MLRGCAKVALFINCCCLALQAKQQHLKYEESDRMQIYELIFDDQDISVATIEKIVWFSPYLIFEPKGAPFQMGHSWMGKDVIEKTVMIPWLEVCNPGYAACDHPILNAAFLRNAEVNLQRGKQQIEKLKQMDIPKELWPIRDHFLVGMEFSLNQHGVRYHYLKSGDVEPMRKLLCEQCPCGKPEEELIRKLKNTKGTARLELSNRTWFNEIIHCRDPKLRYLLEAWQQFLKKYGIEEKYRFPHVE